MGNKKQNEKTASDIVIKNKCQVKPAVPESIASKAQSKIWRRSHSYNSVKNLKSSVKSFNKYMSRNGLEWEVCLKSPVESLDEFAGWLDATQKMPKTIRAYLGFMKNVFRTDGANFTNEEFNRGVVLPKIHPFGDDKVDKEQIKRIVLAVKHDGLKVLSMIEKDTQARPYEILTLKVKDFNLSYDPPYFGIDARHSKNDWPRELFFTHETKELIMQIMEKGNLKPNDFLLLPQKNVDEYDEESFQRYVATVRSAYSRILRETLRKKLPDLNEQVDCNRIQSRYKIHLYSFKKFAFTVMADVLGEMATRAIKGDKEYVMTYYKKNRDERAEDYRKVTPSLLVFSEQKNVRKDLEDQVRKMSSDDLGRVLEFVMNGKNRLNK